jgi:hypothetical protein
MHAKLQEIVNARLKKYGIGRSDGPNPAENLSAVVLNSNGKNLSLSLLLSLSFSLYECLSLSLSLYICLALSPR